MIKRLIACIGLLHGGNALSGTLVDSQTFLNPYSETEEKELTQDDFEGLMKYLYQTCDGPSLKACGERISVTSDQPELYFIEVDVCLKASRCLTYHQILLYNEKLIGNDPTSNQDRQQDEEGIHDLELAEINYLCIKASIDEKDQKAR